MMDKLQQSIAFTQERLDKIGYMFECNDKVPCRSFYEKMEAALIEAVWAMKEKAERNKGCEYCDIARCNGNARPVDKETMRGLKLNFCPMCGKKLEDSK